MIASSSRVSFERGIFGPIRMSDENLRAFHLAIVLRSTPYRLARTVFFSLLAWIASRTLGVVVAEPCVRLASSWPCSRSRPTRVSPGPASQNDPHAPKDARAPKSVGGSLSRQDGAGRSSLMRADHSLTRRDPRIDRLRSRPTSTRDADQRGGVFASITGAPTNAKDYPDCILPSPTMGR